jgi:copper(I)-binding protein
MHPTTRYRTALRTAAAGAVAAALLLAGCGSDSDGASTTTTTKAPAATTTKPAAELTITDVWARKSPSSTSMGAAYMTITSPVDDALVGVSVSTDVAAEAQLHETVMSEDGEMTETTAMGGGEMTTTTAMGEDMPTTTMGGGSMTMREVKRIELPAGMPVELKPGGYHVMLIDLVKPLEVGDTVTLNLLFENAGTKMVTATVREG